MQMSTCWFTGSWNWFMELRRECSLTAHFKTLSYLWFLNYFLNHSSGLVGEMTAMKEKEERKDVNMF